MKIKLAILEKDENYLKRIFTTFSRKYSDKVEMYSFTNEDMVLEELGKLRIDVFLASDCFHVDTMKVPSKCGFAYLVESKDIENVAGENVVCKYQKIDLLFKQILSLYSEKTENVIGIKFDHDCNVLLFTSPCGGVGSTTMAGACAMHFSNRGKKVIYLNLDAYDMTGELFTSDGQFCMTDIIYALKSKKTNLALKLESCVKQDESGVHFISDTRVALDVMELSIEEILRLISEIRLVGSYDVVIINLPFGMDDMVLKLYKSVNAIVLTTDGTNGSNWKITRALESLSIMEQNEDMGVLRKMFVVYNKFVENVAKEIDRFDLSALGKCPKYGQATKRQIAQQIAQLPVFEKMSYDFGSEVNE